VDDILPGLSEALEAMNRGDVEPAVALLDPDVDWRGRPQGHLWWRHAPSCHGPDEVGDCVVVGGRWTMTDGSREVAGRFYQVLRVRGGLIVDIQGCTSRRAAMAYARRAA
jgi:hypothetical protein